MLEKKKTMQARLHLIDEYRGFWIINMIAYHAIWDLVYIFGNNWTWFQSNWAFLWQQCICWSFIFISGFCWQMSRHNLKQGLQVFFAGVLITLATILVMPDSRVLFGVLTLLGSSMLLMIPLDGLLKKVHPLLGAIISFVIFLIVYPVNDRYFGFGKWKLLDLPAEWYANLFTTYLGFTEPLFFSTDYFSILPWFFLFMAGYFTYGVMQGCAYANRLLAKSICLPLGWIGRNSLLIYMLHQPVVYGILYVLSTAFHEATH